MKRFLVILLFSTMCAAQAASDKELTDLYKQFGLKPPPKACTAYLDLAYDHADTREKNLKAENAKLWAAVESSVGDYRELRERHDKLVADYNRLLSAYLSTPTTRTVAAQDPILVPRQPLNCTAMKIGTNIATLNCY